MARKIPRMNEAQLRALVEDWNEHYPAGTSVTVEEDDGTTTETKTRGPAAVLSGHTAVIPLADRTGVFALTRVSPSIRNVP